MSYYISFLGAPGAGKGTQTNKITSALNIPCFATGDLIRNEINKASEIGKQTQEFLTRGELVPDSIINNLFKMYIENGLIDSGFIADGFPRTIAQSRMFMERLSNKKLPIRIFSLEVSLDTLKKRLESRKRSDDTTELVIRRYNIFSTMIKELKSYFGDQIIEIDGDNKENVVFNSIMEHLK